jgi:DNA-binding HxlR family transcriptional regulator
MGKTADYSQQECAVAATLQIVGDPWTLLILSDAFNGVRRFEQWCERLGLARNVLALRLKTLVADGLMEKRLYCERPERHLIALHQWGNRHVYGAGNEPVRYLHKDCGHRFETDLHCAHCGEAAGHHNLVAEPNARTAEFLEILERRRG